MSYVKGSCCNTLSNSQVMAKKFVKSYLESHDNIVFVGLREKANNEDQMTVMYTL
jgi:FMN-dependent NADH-azoreductase